MKRKLYDYIKQLEKKIKNKELDKNLSEEVYTWIVFYQHERLIHLIVTFFVGISMIIILIAGLYFQELLILIMFLILLLLFIPYIIHYYFLENGVQKLYDLYFKTIKK
ncbi:MAG: hypothetical protein IJF92_01160 [Bacilli bacterium]|nr:hypothetical protein [Bacilli bacterium]